MKMKIKINNKSSIFSSEMLFNIYFWGFLLLKPILKYNPNRSTQILFVFASIILMCSFIKMMKQPLKFKFYILIALIMFTLLADLLIRPNDFTIEYIYSFFIYGVVPIHLLSQTKDTELLIRLYSKFAIITFLLYFWDPLNGYSIFGNYMSYGLDFLLPSYIGIYIARRISNKKWAVPLEIVCFIFAFLFANRSVFLSIITLWIVIELFIAKNNYKKVFKIVSIFSLLTISFYYISDILNLLSKLLNNFGIYSYSITRMYNYFSGVAGVTLLSGRLEIWGLAMDVISNNILVGLGTGYFQSEYSMYTHNIFLDILIQYGIIGLIIFITLTINSINSTLNSDKYVRLLGLMFFCLWFPKLFLSLHFYRDIGIWCFIAFGFLKSNRQNKIYSTS